MSLEVDRDEFGYVTAAKTDGEMTVAELIEALGHMPPEARVRRYAEEWGVERVSYDPPDHAVDLN